MPRFRYEASDREQISQYVALASELSGARTLSAAATKHLIGLLEEEVPAWAAISALRDWPKRHSGSPDLRSILRDARDLADRKAERARQEEKANAPTVSDVRPADPRMAEAVAKSLKAINSLPPRPSEFVWWEGIADLEHIPLLKRRYLEERYGDRLRDPAFVRDIKAKVSARLQIEAALPKPSELVAPVRTDAWEFGA